MLALLSACEYEYKTYNAKFRFELPSEKVTLLTKDAVPNDINIIIASARDVMSKKYEEGCCRPYYKIKVKNKGDYSIVKVRIGWDYNKNLVLTNEELSEIISKAYQKIIQEFEVRTGGPIQIFDLRFTHGKAL